MPNNEQLTDMQRRILEREGTEPAFQEGNWQGNKKSGKYYCVACSNYVFSSKDKFDSGTGWPSFTKPATPESIEYGSGFEITGKEVHCSKCNGHLGHVFSDGPKKEEHQTGTGKRYCINGVVLNFKEETERIGEENDK